ncbi:hypothetical protein [Hydrogenophaga sp. BPS33]|uniref:hypothetical protein n=1 Tax=Hydrogenophaga sp. BPS33 TaxID=2651974 RepID=UPI00131F56AF|nr:hypothetical protein [Hydrogenophaga sp. BPS33]QHE84943.1 hypothetical protein F9K07_08610 [Hydrogenophaga sp. BPS33]
MTTPAHLKRCVALLALLVLAGCGERGDGAATAPAPAKPGIPAQPDPVSPRFVENPDFTVVLELTAQATEAWKRTNEPIVLVAEFADEYGPGMTALTAPQKRSVPEPGPVRFSGIAIPLDKLKALRDPNYEIYVGVQATAPAAAFDCGYVQQLVQDLHHRSFALACKLKSEG